MEKFLNNYWGMILEWATTNGLRILLIVIVAMTVHYFMGRLIKNIIRRLVKQGSSSKAAEEKRENTLIQVMSGSANIVIWISATMMILSEFGIAIGPLLAAAGVAGLALGFGGQYLIRDIISGIFILLENQYRAGDVVCFNGTCGLVENVSLRMTTLRDLNGTVHHVPHGEVNIVSNQSKVFSRVNLNIGVSYEASLEHVIKVVNQVGEEMANDPAWSESIIKQPKFLRVEDFADSAVVIKILGDTLPLKQWEVAGELRMRLKIAFDREKIEIPFPQRVVTTIKS